MAKVTYLIGAGASFHSLPLIKTMGIRMQAYSLFLKDQKQNGILKHEFLDTFISELDILIKIEKERTSIDAYAKELYLSGEEMKLLRLKAILSSYLIFEQLIKPDDLIFYSHELDYTAVPHPRKPYEDSIQFALKNHIDKRYYTFWGELLNDGNKLPTNVKILSWNYDMQFESSYAYIKKYKLDFTQQVLQVFPSPIYNIELNKFCILKLNGTAGLIEDYSKKEYFNLFDCREHPLMENLDYLIEILSKNYHRAFNKPLFSFAWENEGIVGITRQHAIEVTQQTEILVIIGYSFPNFNKAVDREIFKSLPKIRKVYFQAPNEELPDLIDKLDGINPDLKKITKGISNLSTFYVPAEL